MGKKKYKKLKNEINDIHDAILTWDKKVNRISDKLDHVDERTMALDNVKLNNWVDHTKQLENKVKILMDRTSVDYTKMLSKEITYQECIALLECMRDRGAYKYEIDGIKKLMNKYIFRCRLLLVDDEIPTPEEIIDGKKEVKND